MMFLLIASILARQGREGRAPSDIEALDGIAYNAYSAVTFLL